MGCDVNQARTRGRIFEDVLAGKPTDEHLGTGQDLAQGPQFPKDGWRVLIWDPHQYSCARLVYGFLGADRVDA